MSVYQNLFELSLPTCTLAVTDKSRAMTSCSYMMRRSTIQIDVLFMISCFTDPCLSLSHPSGGHHTARGATQEAAAGLGGGHEEHLGGEVQGTLLGRPGLCT